jgi:phage terminase large subunit-like protein
VKAEGSKVARAEGVSPLFEAARVLFPETAPSWLGPLVEELVGFPAGRHDDMVDAFVYALARLRRHGGTGAGATVQGEPLLGIGERLGDGGGVTADTQS